MNSEERAAILGQLGAATLGESGGLPSGRRANSSGGVRSSWPPANGSCSGSIGSAGGARSSPPGRVARSPATITRWPVSGSMRISGT